MVFLIILFVCLSGCDEEWMTDEPAATGSLAPDSTRNYDSVQLSTWYLDQAERDYHSLAQYAGTFHQGLLGFLDNPDEPGLEQLRQLWLTAHRSYTATALHRYFLQRLAATSSEAASIETRLNELHYRVNYWPILPGYLDYVYNYPDSGLIFDLSVPLSENSLRSQHGVFDLSEVTTGFHVLEFLLWGTNNAPGMLRSSADFLAESELSTEQLTAGMQVADLENNRRRELLRIVSQILLQDTNAISEIWLQQRGDLERVLAGLGRDHVLLLLLDSQDELLTRELLTGSLYLLLNGDYVGGIQSPFSHSSQNSAVSYLASVENLLRGTNGGATEVAALYDAFYPEFSRTIFQQLDSGRECLVVLYTTVEPSVDPAAQVRNEQAVVECINLLSNTKNTFAIARVSLALSMGALNGVP
ncbi:MAG: imelysin family protein [Pseudohongiellaceae bacterium]